MAATRPWASSVSLRTRAEAFGFSEQIGQILIPEEEVVELRNGKWTYIGDCNAIPTSVAMRIAG